MVKDNKILLIRRFKNGEEYWVLPGGGVEDGENLDEALTREVREETCLDLLKYDFLGSCEEEGSEHYFYSCVLDNGVPEIGGPEKENNCKTNTYVLEWILINEVKKMSVYPVSFKKYLK